MTVCNPALGVGRALRHVWSADARKRVSEHQAKRGIAWLGLHFENGLRYNGDGDHSGAQTERRGGAGPVGGLLGGKDPTGRLTQSSFRIVPMPRFLVNSELLLLPNRSR